MVVQDSELNVVYPPRCSALIRDSGHAHPAQRFDCARLVQELEVDSIADVLDAFPHSIVPGHEYLNSPTRTVSWRSGVEHTFLRILVLVPHATSDFADVETLAQGHIQKWIESCIGTHSASLRDTHMDLSMGKAFSVLKALIKNLWSWNRQSRTVENRGSDSDKEVE